MRHIAFLAMVLAAWCTLAAQSQRDIAVGAKAGATLSRLNFNPTVPQTMLPGMTAGVTFRYIEEKSFGLVAELNVSQRGWKETFEQADYRYSHSFTYLELPVMTHIFFGGKRVKGFFNLGPELNVMLAHKESSNFDYNNATVEELFVDDHRHIEQWSMDVNNKLDYGICLGTGIEVSLNSKHALQLEGRFYYGLTDVFPNHKIDVFSSSNPMTIMVTLGYLYRLGH